MDEIKHCFNVTAEMLEAYKIKTIDDMRNNQVFVRKGVVSTDISVELLLWLIERAQAWERLEHDERVHHRREE